MGLSIFWGFRVQGLGMWMQDCRVYGAECRMEGSGLRVRG